MAQIVKIPEAGAAKSVAWHEAKLVEKFNLLANKWESETRLIASPSKIASHARVLEIIAMGPSVVPLILRRMKSHPWFWFRALMELTKADPNPVTDAMRGDMQKMTEAWIKWGEDCGIV